MLSGVADASNSNNTAPLDATTLHGGTLGRVAEIRTVPGLTVAGHPDPSRVGDQVRLPELLAGREVELSRLGPLFTPPRGGPSEPLADPFVSRRPVVLRALGDGMLVDASQCGSAVELDGEPVDGAMAIDAGRLARGVTLTLAERVVLVLHTMGPPEPAWVEGAQMTGASRAMTALRKEITKVARTEVPVLIRGESGVGKELVARAIHAGSTRKLGRCVSVNMAAIPASTAASELFGHVKGAFTGAARPSEGYFGAADGGTLFMDEVGEASPEVQVMLLRVLESGEIQRLGSQTPRQVDVRLVAATDADLEARVEAGTFRLPLLHRLATYTLDIAPLRARREDVGPLLVYFLRAELQDLDAADRLTEDLPDVGPWLPARVVARLVAHDWPGNVRQLRNVARQLAIAGLDEPRARLTSALERELSPRPGQETVATDAPSVPAEAAKPRAVDEVTDDELMAALREHKFNVSRTAKALGLPRSTVYGLIERSPSVRKANELPAEEVKAAWETHAGDLGATAAALEVSRRGLKLRLRELGLEG